MKTKISNESLYATSAHFQSSRSRGRKIAIIESAIDCIASIGVERITLEELGKRTGMTKAHVAYHFKKCDLIIEATIELVVATVQQHTVARVGEATSARERLIAFVDALYEWIKNYPKHGAVILLLYYYASSKPKYQKMHAEIRRLGAERIDAILDLMKYRGNKEQRTRCAKHIQALLTGHLIDLVTATPPRKSWEFYRAGSVEEVLALAESKPQA